MPSTGDLRSSPPVLHQRQRARCTSCHPDTQAHSVPTHLAPTHPAPMHPAPTQPIPMHPIVWERILPSPLPSPSHSSFCGIQSHQPPIPSASNPISLQSHQHPILIAAPHPAAAHPAAAIQLQPIQLQPIQLQPIRCQHCAPCQSLSYSSPAVAACPGHTFVGESTCMVTPLSRASQTRKTKRRQDSSGFAAPSGPALLVIGSVWSPYTVLRRRGGRSRISHI